MPADDEYKIPINRGRLKIKGVEDHGRIKKNKKSKRKEATRSSSSTRSEKQQSDQFAEAANDGQDDQKKLEEPRHTGDDKDTDPLKGKTKAEISYEITKKKRVCIGTSLVLTEASYR